MSEKPDLKTFYTSSLPTPDNILNFYESSEKNISSKKEFIDLSNTGFAFLAHLNSDSVEKLESHRKIKYYAQLFRGCKNLKIIMKNREINPSAVPMIQRYMKIFEAYEKQNGLTNPYAIKEGKEPGDN